MTSRLRIAVLAVLLGVCGPVACEPPAGDEAPEPAREGTWLRASGTLDDQPIQGHAFVESTVEGYCEAFRARWSLAADAEAALQAALADTEPEPSKERCEARAAYWEERLVAEEHLYFQAAEHRIFFFENQVDDEDGGLTVGLPVEAQAAIGRDLPDGVFPMVLSTVRATELTFPLPVTLLNCDLGIVQEAAESELEYPGPPRERWSGIEGGATLTPEGDGEEAWRVEVTDAVLEFDREISYTTPTPDNGWDPREVDYAEREPRQDAWSARFERCDVEPTEEQWWDLFLWALGAGY